MTQRTPWCPILAASKLYRHCPNSHFAPQHWGFRRCEIVAYDRQHPRVRCDRRKILKITPRLNRKQHAEGLCRGLIVPNDLFLQRLKLTKGGNPAGDMHVSLSRRCFGRPAMRRRLPRFLVVPRRVQTPGGRLETVRQYHPHGSDVMIRFFAECRLPCLPMFRVRGADQRELNPSHPKAI